MLASKGAKFNIWLTLAIIGFFVGLIILGPNEGQNDRLGVAIGAAIVLPLFVFLVGLTLFAIIGLPIIFLLDVFGRAHGNGHPEWDAWHQGSHGEWGGPRSGPHRPEVPKPVYLDDPRRSGRR